MGVASGVRPSPDVWKTTLLTRSREGCPAFTPPGVSGAYLTLSERGVHALRGCWEGQGGQVRSSVARNTSGELAITKICLFHI
eukprot:6173203-Pleurochrysis_carterae.AAC.3